MTLGKRIKTARQEAGLSQTALCGDKITRNMLSLIENDAAVPSVDTLQYLAQQLGKTAGYLLDGQSVSPNAALLDRARNADPETALVLLKEYVGPDSVHDAEYNLLLLLTSLSQAEKALAAGKTGYCRELLMQAETAAKQTPYDTRELKRRRILLRFSLDENKASELERQLPPDDGTHILHATAALQRGEYSLCRAYLASDNSEKAVFLLAESYFMEKDYVSAVKEYEKLTGNLHIYRRLEQCFRALNNYEQAYFYACKQRDQESL